MREDRYVGSIDASAVSYYLRGGGVDMTAVRRARIGLNIRHFPLGPRQAIPKAPALQRGLSSLERAEAHLAHLEALEQCTVAAKANVQRIKDRLAPALSERERREAALQQAARSILQDRLGEAVLDEDEDGAVKLASMLRLFEVAPQLITHKIISEQAFYPDVKRAVAKLSRSSMPETPPGPSPRRPERSNLVTDTYSYFAGGDEGSDVGAGVAGVAVFMAPQKKSEAAAGMRREFYVTQVWRVTKAVGSDRQVHILNRSYLVAGADYVEEGVPMLRPPASRSYQVLEPGDAWVGPYYSPDEAEQVADWWKSEMSANDDDPDRMLGWDDDRGMVTQRARQPGE